MPTALSDSQRADPSRGARTRVVVSGLAGAFAVVALLVAATGWWSMRSLTDSSWVTPRVADLLADPVVSDAVAERVVDSVVELVDLRSAAAELAPSQLEPVVDLMLATLRDRAEGVVSGYVRRDEVRETIAAASGRAYDAVAGAVEGRDVIEGVVVVDDEVRIVVLPLVGRTLEALQEVGLLAGVDLPDLARGGDPSTQRAELERVLGRELPDDFGEIVVYRSDAVERAGDGLATAQTVFVSLRRVVWLAFAAGTVLVSLSVWAARRRLRAVGFLAVALGVGVASFQVVSTRLVRAAVETSSAPAGRLVIDDLLGELQQRLVRTTATVAVLTVAVALTAVALTTVATGRRSDGSPER